MSIKYFESLNFSSQIVSLFIFIPFDFISLLISLFDKFLSIVEIKLIISLLILKLLIFVSGEDEITIYEIGEINDFIQSEAGNNTNIIMGIGEDKNLKKGISVTIIATGFNSEQQHEIVNTEAKKIIHTLEEDQSFVQDLTDHDKEFKNNEIYVDNCSLFIVNYMLSGIDSNNCLRRFTLSADSYHKEGYVEVRTYRCESHLKITKKTLTQLKTYIEYVNG